jgi:hypothetical protein
MCRLSRQRWQQHPYIDQAIEEGKVIFFMVEGLADSSPGSEEFLTSEFQKILEYLTLKSAQIDVVSLTEYVQGLTNPRRLT